jgi:hypothetical protein
MLRVARAVAGLKFSRLETFQVRAQRLANQCRTVHPRPPGGSIGSAEECRTQDNLDGFHTVEYTPHLTQQSTGLAGWRGPVFQGLGLFSRPCPSATDLQNWAS